MPIALNRYAILTGSMKENGSPKTSSNTDNNDLNNIKYSVAHSTGKLANAYYWCVFADYYLHYDDINIEPPDVVLNIAKARGNIAKALIQAPDYSDAIVLMAEIYFCNILQIHKCINLQLQLKE